MEPGSELQLGGTPAGYRSGFVSIVGRPNVGKSTLLNQIVRGKVAITSDRPQTTRNAIRGISTTTSAQIVFVDTPGLHKPHTALGDRLNKVARDTLGEVDAIVFVVDAADGIGAGDSFIAAELRGLTTPVIVALNKIDRTDDAALREGRDRISALGSWPAMATSGRTGAGVAELHETLVELMDEGPLYYPPDARTDQPERRLIAELLREKLIGSLSDELPHSIAVAVDDITTRDGGEVVEVDITIWVERESQKGIVIGRGGGVLKEAGSRARKEIEALLGSRVFLHQRVKVARDWQHKDSMVERFDYGT